MKKAYLFFLAFLFLTCNNTPEQKIEIDQSKHLGLSQLETTFSFKILHSSGKTADAQKQAELVNEAYQFLSKIMGPKDDFCLLVVSKEDWKRNAYSPISGMPGYYKGNLIVGAGENDVATGYAEMIKSLPKELTSDLINTYTNDAGALDMRLFFDKLVIHELTHSFQDTKNQEGYSMSRWLEEIHANMGLYAFYKTKRPDELKYVMSLVNFSVKNPPPDLAYSSLADFDANYFDISPPNYGQYQMSFTKAAEVLIDSLGNDVLKPLNDFLVKYDESWKEKLSADDFRERLSKEVDPLLLNVMDNWDKY